jgi:WD40 repeat protein
MASATLPASAGEPRDLVFISYSRPDRDWLEHLLIFLKPYTRQNLKIWADQYIQVGEEWRRDISMALSRSCVGVLLVSQNFLASDFIYKEELPPLLEGAAAKSIKLVPIPISAFDYQASGLSEYQFAHPRSRPLDKLRKSDRNAAFVKIVKKIVAEAQKGAPDLATRPSVRPERTTEEAPLAPVATTSEPGMLHGVPGQRPHHLSRPEFFAPLKQTVLGTTDQAIGITGAKPEVGDARIGLHGMGGIGKTVLASDLVNDDEVRRAFPDGIFWLTLGQAIEPLRLQGDLAAYMAGEAKAYATVNEAREQLRQLFDGKACLLVLDDLWRPQDAEPFDVLGPRSRLLVTTRDADLLVALGARELPLDVLSEELALELLASWSGQAWETLPAASRKVAESCGYLPLALALAGARVQGGARWDDVLSALERGRLEFLDHPYGSVFSSLRFSTDALTDSARDRYFELAVFPEDAAIPVETICTLWHRTGGMEPDASRDLLHRLHRRALLIRSEDGKRISFHDLQHDFLRLNIASLVEAHAALVDAYYAAAPSGWASGPDDGYFFQRLPQHLAAADRLDQVKELLCDYEWLAAKLSATNITALLADYDLIVNGPELTLVQQALRLSIPALVRNPSLLAGQLLGRLRGADSPRVKALVAGAETGPGRPWFRPRFASLTPPGGPLRQILVGHTGPVEAVAFLPDGCRAISGSYDNTLRLWELATGENLRTLEGHAGSVTAVAVLADGRRALSGSYDNTLRLWDLASGETMRTFKGHAGSVNAVAVLADGSRAISGSSDTTLRLWDLATGETMRTLEGHAGSVTAVAVVTDGSRAISGSSDTTLRLWDLATGETLHTLKGHTNWVTAVALAVDGTHALSGSWDETLRLWDLSTGEIMRIFEGHTSGVRAVTVLADGSRAISGSHDKTLRLWDLATGETLRTLEGHSSSINEVAVLADGSCAISGSHDSTLRVWDLAIGETLRTLKGRTSYDTAVAVLADGSRAISGSDDHTLQLWDLKAGERLRTFEGHAGWVTAVAVLANGSRAISGSNDDNTLRLWDLSTGETLRTLEGHTSYVIAVAVLADGSRAISGSYDKTARLWDLATGETLRILEKHTGGVSTAAVLADGRHALSGSWDNTLRLWDLATGETLRILEGHDNSVTSVAVLAGGSRAISGSYDRTMRLWDLATGETLRTFEGHTGSVTAVAVLADGSRALSGSYDNTILLWDLATGECLAEYVADAPVRCLALSRTDLVVAGSTDSKIVHVLEIRDR